MELDELKKMWSAYDQKLERNWQLNLHLLRRTNLDKVKSKLRYLVMLHSVSLAICIPLIILFAYFIFSHTDAMHFVISGSILMLWTMMIAYSAIDQLKMIHEIDYAAPVLEIQRRLVSLKLAMVKYMRYSVMVIPLYLAHILVWFELFFDVDMYQVANQAWWVGQIIFSAIACVPLTIWLYRNLSPQHINKKWMSNLISGSGGKQVQEALDLMVEIENFEEKSSVV